MIGQTALLRTIDGIVDNGMFPRFTIIQGADGSGKNLFVEHIRDKTGYDLIPVNLTVDDIRSCIRSAYEVTVPVIFYLRNADELSPAAKNALLKITEEPPNGAYFIMTVLNENSMPDTLRSRATMFQMEPYTFGELRLYVDIKHMKMPLATFDICENPGEIELLDLAGSQELFDFVYKVIHNIAEVSVANAFKIAESIAFKEDETDKFDLGLFWKAVILEECQILADDAVDLTTEGLKAKAKIVMSTKECIDMITKTKGINKRNVFDIWILDIRKILGEADGSN